MTYDFALTDSLRSVLTIGEKEPSDPAALELLEVKLQAAIAQTNEDRQIRTNRACKMAGAFGKEEKNQIFSEIDVYHRRYLAFLGDEEEEEEEESSCLDDGFEELMGQVASVLQLAEPRKSYALSRLAKRNGIQESRLITWYFAEQNGKDKSRRFTGPEFMSLEFDEQEWFINGLVPKSSAILVTASPGTGKSYLSYAFAKAILSGNGLDGRLSCKGRVLILQGDEGMKNSRRKFDRLHMEDYSNWEIDFAYDFTNLMDLERQIVEGNFDFVICDSYATLNRYCGYEEKDTAFANTAMELRAMADRLGTSFILIHHLNKGGTTRGTTALEANVDEVIRLTREDEKASSRRFMTWCKSRAECQDNLELLYDDETGELRLVEAEEGSDDRDTRPANTEEKLLLQFRHNKGTWYEIDELVLTTGSTYNSLRQTLAKLFKQGKVLRERRHPNPDDRRKWFYVYCIPPSPTTPISNVADVSVIPSITATSETSETKKPPTQEGGVSKEEDISDEEYAQYLQAETHIQQGIEGIDLDTFDDDRDDDYGSIASWEY